MHNLKAGPTSDTAKTPQGICCWNYLCDFLLICLVKPSAREFVRSFRNRASDLCPPTFLGPALWTAWLHLHLAWEPFHRCSSTSCPYQSLLGQNWRNKKVCKRKRTEEKYGWQTLHVGIPVSFGVTSTHSLDDFKTTEPGGGKGYFGILNREKIFYSRPNINSQYARLPYKPLFCIIKKDL